MVDLKDLRENPDRYRKAAQVKRISVDIDELLQLDSRRRELEQQRQQITAEKNQIGKQIGQLAGQLKKASPGPEGGPPGADEDSFRPGRPSSRPRSRSSSRSWRSWRRRSRRFCCACRSRRMRMCPLGKDDTENVEVRRWGTVRSSISRRRTTCSLGAELGMIDVERGVKLAGTRSYFLTGWGALLHQAVLRLALDLMLERGFTPMSVPVLVREGAMQGTGYFPLGREQAYALTNEEPPVFLVGTAEVSLTAYHMDEILDVKELPQEVRRHEPVLPPRGRHLRQGHGRHLPHPPVRQGRAGGRSAATTSRRASAGTRRSPRTPRRCCRSWSCRTAWWRSAPATWARARWRSTTSRRGCPRARATARRTPRRGSTTSRRGG